MVSELSFSGWQGLFFLDHRGAAHPRRIARIVPGEWAAEGLWSKGGEAEDEQGSVGSGFDEACILQGPQDALALGFIGQ